MTKTLAQCSNPKAQTSSNPKKGIEVNLLVARPPHTSPSFPGLHCPILCFSEPKDHSPGQLSGSTWSDSSAAQIPHHPAVGPTLHRLLINPLLVSSKAQNPGPGAAGAAGLFRPRGVRFLRPCPRSPCRRPLPPRRAPPEGAARLTKVSETKNALPKGRTTEKQWSLAVWTWLWVAWIWAYSFVSFMIYEDGPVDMLPKNSSPLLELAPPIGSP